MARSICDKGEMRSGHLKRLVRLVAWALTGLIVQGFYAPGSASASCSHRPGASSTSLFNLHRFDELILQGASSRSDDNLLSSSNNPSLPRPRGACSGLSCSSHVPFPVSSTIQRHDQSDRWVAPGLPIIPDKGSAPAQTTDEPTPSPTGQISSIFHPPRI